jgi:hypothetical protein
MEKHSAPPDTLPVIREGLGKNQIATLAERSVDRVLEEGHAVQVAEALAAMEEFTKAVRKDERFVQFLRDELVKHHGKLFTLSGAKLELCEAAVRYDYSGSAEWRELDEEIRRLTEEKKMLEERLRTISPGKMAVDTETGEVTEGPLKSSRSTYRITLSR